MRIVCKYCGHVWDGEPERTWTLTAPFPDKEGRVTITVMGIFRCPVCGRSWRGVVAKYKAGGEASGGRAWRDRLIEILNSATRITLNEIAEKLGGKFKKESIAKAISYLIRSGQVRGRLEGDVFVRE